MNKDQNPDPGTGIPEDAESDDDDTLDLTEAMAVTPPKDSALRRDGETSDETIDLADTTTLINGDDAESIPGPDEAPSPEAADDDEEVIDLASTSPPSPAASIPAASDQEEDEEFGRPQATMAISPEELMALGVSRAEADSPEESSAEFAGDDTLREQPTDLNTEEILDTPAPVEADAEPDEEEDDRFLDIDTGTLVAMGREFELNNGNAPDATLALGDLSDDDEDDVIDLGALGASTRDSSESGADRDAETVIAPPLGDDEPISTGEPISLSEDDLAADDPVDRDAATAFMPTGPPSQTPPETADADLPDRSEDDEAADRDAATVFMPAGIDDETQIPALGPDSGAEDFETFRLTPDPDGDDKTAAERNAESAGFSGARESKGGGGIPAGGFSDLDRSTPDADDGEAVDADAETLFMSMSGWDDEDEEAGDDNLSALELLDSISGLPDHGEDAGSDDDGLRSLEDDSAIPDAMEELYGLMETSRVADPDLGSGSKADSEPDSEKTEAETRESEEKAGAETGGEASGEADEAAPKSAGAAEAAADSGPSEKTAGKKAVALPEARRRGDSDEERCFSITPDQMQTILERVVDKIFSEKIEKILTDVIERAVADEMRKLENYFFEELDDRGGQ